MISFWASFFSCVKWKFSWVHLNEGHHHDNKNRFFFTVNCFECFPLTIPEQSFYLRRRKIFCCWKQKVSLLFDPYQVWKCFVSNHSCFFLSFSLFSMLFWNIYPDVECYSFGTCNHFPLYTNTVHETSVA